MDQEWPEGYAPISEAQFPPGYTAFDPAKSLPPGYEQTTPEFGVNHRAGALATGVNSGIAGVLGAPVDLFTAGINKAAQGVDWLGEKAGHQGPILGQIANPIGGSQSIEGGIDSVVGRSPIQDKADAYLYSGGRGVGSVGAGIATGGALNAAEILPLVAKGLGGGTASLTEAVKNLVAGAGAGTGALAGRDVVGAFTDNPLAQEVGSMAGGLGGGLAAGYAPTAAENLWNRYAAPTDTRAMNAIRDAFNKGVKGGAPDVPAMQYQFGQGGAVGDGLTPKPLALADVENEPLQALGERVAQTPGTGAQTARDFLNERDAGAGPRLLNDLNENLGVGPSAYRTAQALSGQRAGQAAPLYEKANAAAPLYSDRLEQFTKEPIIQKGLAQGMEIQRLEALAKGDTFDPNSYSVNLDDLGQPSFAPAGPAKEPWRPPDINEFLARAGGVKDYGGELRSMDLHRVNPGMFGRLANNNGMPLDQAREMAEEAHYLLPGSDINDLLGAIDSSARGKPVYSWDDQNAAGAWNAWRAAESKAPQGPSDFAPGQAFDPNEMFQGLKRGWDTRTLDAAKRGLDNILEQYRDPTTGVLRLDQQGRAIDQVRQSFLGEIDRLNPDYAAARAAWSGPSQSMSAMKQGANIFNMQPEQISDAIGRLAPSDKPFFQIGARDALAQRVAKTSAGGNEALRIVGNQQVQDQLRPLFSSDSQFNAFINQAKLESLMYGTRSRMLGNSATFRRLAASGEGAAPGITSNLLTAGGAALTGEPIVAASSAARALGNLFSRMSGLSPSVRASIAQKMFNSDPGALQQTLGSLPAQQTGFPFALAPPIAVQNLLPLLPGERPRY